MSEYQIPAEVLRQALYDEVFRVRGHDETDDICHDEADTEVREILEGETGEIILGAANRLAAAAYRAGQEQALRAAANDLGIGQPRWVSVDSLLNRADQIARDYGAEVNRG